MHASIYMLQKYTQIQQMNSSFLCQKSVTELLTNFQNIIKYFMINLNCLKLVSSVLHMRTSQNTSVLTLSNNLYF